jgi:anti-sigma factor RsiW
MTCDKAAELLSAYVDSQLDAAERGSLVSHLEGCHGCRREWVGLERARTLSVQSAHSMPLALRASIQRSIDELVPETAAPEAGWRGLLRWPSMIPAPAWAVLAAVLTAGATAYGLLPKEEPVPLDRLLTEHVLTDQQSWAATRGWTASSLDDTSPSEEGG